MKRPLAALTLVVVVLSLAAAPATRPTRTFTDKATGVSVTVDRSWARAKPDPHYALGFFPPQDATMRNEPVRPILAVIVKPRSGNATLEQIADALRAEFKSRGMDEVDASDLSIDGNPAKEFIVKKKAPGGQVLKLMNVVSYAGDKMLVVSFAGSPGTFDRFQLDAEAAAKSITVAAK